jgi:hypothetical protein
VKRKEMTGAELLAYQAEVQARRMPGNYRLRMMREAELFSTAVRAAKRIAKRKKDG